jgi:hypothetical protein
MEVIYDFETLSQNPNNGVVLSFAMLYFDPKRFNDNPYTFPELLSKTRFFKFDVQDQVKNYAREIDMDTVEWWNRQGPEARKQLKPSSNDKKFDEFFEWLNEGYMKVNKVWTRRNTFDPIFLTNILKQLGHPEMWDWWLIRDTISTIEALSIGTELHNSFMPDGVQEHFVKHDPCHDIAVDVLRMQTLIRAFE